MVNFKAIWLPRLLLESKKMKNNQNFLKSVSKLAKIIAIAGFTLAFAPAATAADAPTGTLNVVTVVVNTHYGTDTADAFSFHVWTDASERVSSPTPGAAGSGRAYVLPVGSYVVTQAGAVGYRGMWSGPITPGGTVAISSGSNITVTRTIYDVAGFNPFMTSDDGTSTTPETTPGTTSDETTDETTPTPTRNGGKLPDTATPFGNTLLLGGALMLIGGIGFASRKILVK